MINKPRVFVVIPNKNGINHLSYSLKSLTKTTYTNYQTILVDNCSTDGSINFVERNYPLVKITKNDIDKGFAGSINAGIKYALSQEADYIAVYSGDIQVLPEWIDLVIDIFHERSDVGLVGYTEIPKEREELFYGAKDLKDKVEYKEVKGLPGCLYLCPSRVFKHIGLFDEGYYMYGEDNDFFHRLIKAGYRIIQTNIPVWHYGEGSSESVKKQQMMTKYVYRNWLRFAIKNQTVFQIILTLGKMLSYTFLPRSFWKNKFEHIPQSVNRLLRFNLRYRIKCLVYSILWNIINIIPTLKSRYEANRQMKIGIR